MFQFANFPGNRKGALVTFSNGFTVTIVEKEDGDMFHVGVSLSHMGPCARDVTIHQVWPEAVVGNDGLCYISTDQVADFLAACKNWNSPKCQTLLARM